MESEGPQTLLAKVLPRLRPIRQRPLVVCRPAMSSMPSPSKSPTTWSMVAGKVDQSAHCVCVKERPSERLTNQSRAAASRPTMSAVPSPSKSPIWTFCQLAAGFQETAFSTVEKVVPSE